MISIINLEKLDYKIRNFILKYKPKKSYNLAVFLKTLYRILNIYKLDFFNISKKKNYHIENKEILELKEKGLLQLDLKNFNKSEILKKFNFLLKKNLFDESKTFLKTYEIDVKKKYNQKYLSILFDKNIIEYVESYLGKNITLQNVLFMYSENKTFERGRSQELHVDGDISDQIKVFIYLSEVTLESGPLCAYSIKDSKELLKKFKHKNIIKRKSQKFSDELVDEEFKKKIKIFLGKDKIQYINTSKCLHFGSRIGNKDRYLLMFQFLKNYNYRVRLFPNKKIDFDKNIFNNYQINLLNNLLKYKANKNNT